VLEEFLQGRPSLPHGDYVSVAAAGVVFAYNNLPPLEATRLEAISGAAAVRALPEVVRYLPILRPGDGIDNAAATNELDLLLGRAAGSRSRSRWRTAAARPCLRAGPDADRAAYRASLAR
jgi:hypothetical protein